MFKYEQVSIKAYSFQEKQKNILKLRQDAFLQKKATKKRVCYIFAAMQQKLLTFSQQAPYYTVGAFTPSTRYVWVVCHGYGQLARYFLRRFDVLPADEHYLIAPEGLSRFYLDAAYQKVGASWLTKEDRPLHLQNQWAYLEQVYAQELAPLPLAQVKLVLFGFSQGVATVSRWAAHRQIPFTHLVLWAGGFPEELTPDDFAFRLPEATTFLLIGDEDPYASAFDIAQQKKRVEHVIGPAEIISFAGGHEVRREVLSQLVGRF